MQLLLVPVRWERQVCRLIVTCVFLKQNSVDWFLFLPYSPHYLWVAFKIQIHFSMRTMATAEHIKTLLKDLKAVPEEELHISFGSDSIFWHRYAASPVDCFEGQSSRGSIPPVSWLK